MRSRRPDPDKLFVFVNPIDLRQLDPRGVALFWPDSGRGKGLLAIFEVCEIPGCPTRELLAWCVLVSDEICAVEIEGPRRVTVYELPPAHGERRRRPERGPELYASIDIDRWTLAPHPLHVPDRGSRRLLEKLRAELDDEVRSYLRETFESLRRQVDERHVRALDEASERHRLSVVPVGEPGEQLN